jgi:hypothetical protein
MRAPVVLGAAAATFVVIQLCSAAGQDAAEGLKVEVRESVRHLTADGLPNHTIGRFTEALRAQNYQFQTPAVPRAGRRATPWSRGAFGIALNGVVFDPANDEYWNDQRRSGWTYEAVTNKPGYGLDINNGHIGDNGAYHYHGSPIGLLKEIVASEDMRLIGYAADGFPIYDQFGYVDPDDPMSGTKKLSPSYRIKPGNRPTAPGGPHDGTFFEDWHYVKDAGELDECNGRTGVTPEYPNGTYYYVVTEKFPCVPRMFRGTPDRTFQGRGREQQRGGGFD